MARTMKELDAYVASMQGRSIDIDGAYGAQCWDQMSHYMQWLKVPAERTYTNYGGTKPHAGWACNVFHNAKAAGLLEWFTVVKPDAAPRKGDIAFWDYGSALYPKSHVATVLGAVGAGSLRSLSQNPGPTRTVTLSKAGLLGYLRPKSSVLRKNETTDPLGEIMAHYPTKKSYRDDMAKLIRNHVPKAPMVSAYQPNPKKTHKTNVATEIRRATRVGYQNREKNDKLNARVSKLTELVQQLIDGLAAHQMKINVDIAKLARVEADALSTLAKEAQAEDAELDAELSLVVDVEEPLDDEATK